MATDLPDSVAEQPTHGDILLTLGEVKGVVGQIHNQLIADRDSNKLAHARIDALSSRVWFIFGIGVACSFLLPIVITAMAPKILFEHQVPEQHLTR